jgi:hypothetical protein
MAKFTPFIMTRDINGYNGFGLPFSVDQFSAALEAETEDTLTVPSACQKYLAVFSFDPGTAVWVSLNGTAEIPTGTFDQTTSEQNPTARIVSAGDILSFITTETTANVGVIFYGIQ